MSELADVYREEWPRAVSILTRVLGNLMAIYRERECHEQALATVELLLVLWPDAAEHIRIRGLLYEQLECFSSALSSVSMRRWWCPVFGLSTSAGATPIP